MLERGAKELFSKRERIKRVKFWGGIFHLLSVTGLVISLLWVFPSDVFRHAHEMGAQGAAMVQDRQRLFEALDKLVRYEDYYREIHGRYTRDLSRLFLPEKLSNGDWEDMHRHYELSVLDLQPDHILVLAVGVDRSDRATIDESHRISANFILPTPAKSYLAEEGDRLIRLSRSGKPIGASIYTGYWQIEKNSSENGDQWVAVGIKGSVIGEKHEEFGNRGLASIFETVSEKVKSQMGPDSEPTLPRSESFDTEDVKAFLRAAREAQHIHKRERGHYARRWEELDSVTGFHFLEKQSRVKNIRIHPIEVTQGDANFRITLEGTSGALLGEQFVMDDGGEVRELRYTDALINQLQESTKILESTSKFQISVDPGESPEGNLDRKKQEPVKSIDQL